MSYCWLIVACGLLFVWVVWRLVACFGLLIRFACSPPDTQCYSKEKVSHRVNRMEELAADWSYKQVESTGHFVWVASKAVKFYTEQKI